MFNVIKPRVELRQKLPSQGIFRIEFIDGIKDRHLHYIILDYPL